ncbi:MAG: transposase zinc-binding domain-containing protein, partial [Gammaproteobacteria bacterium]
MDQAARFAPAGKGVHYERRRPEETVLYQLVQEHLETFLAQVELETGAGLPEFVKAEFDAFLECGILAHGFLRLRCADCAHEKLVAFSCKKRGFCPSCGARRMAETAAHLVDHVIPQVPVREWVLSFPIPLRLLFAAHPELLAPVLQIVHRVISTFLIQQAGLKRTDANTGAVTLIQRFGSAANLNIHLHCLVLDGVYRASEGVPVFHPVRAPTPGELQTILTRIIKRLMRLLTRQGYLIEEQGMTYLEDTDPEAALAPLQAAACTYRIAF